jgi:hypothetical protein
MNREDVLKQSEQALEELAEALAQGRSDTLIRYLEMLSRFHQYSFGNCMLIALQRSDTTHVAGFQRWKQLGRYVKKDEKGILILAPIVRRRKANDERVDDADGEAKGVGSFLRSVAWGTWLLDVFVLLPHGVPAVGFHVGS